jgi:hypothetical protein
MKRSTVPIILIVAGLGAHQPVGAQVAPALTTFQNLPGLGRVQGINKAGAIVAHTGGGDEVQGVLIDPSGKATSISVPGSEQTLPYGLDNSTRVVGAYNLPDHGGAHGFLYFQGAFTTIDVPGGTDTRARAINDAQQIVGDYNDRSSHRHGFLYDRGAFTQIDGPGAVNTYVYGLNNVGTIVGYYTDSQGHQHGFVSDKKGVSTVDVRFPGSTDTFLYGINNLGIIVGSYIDSAGTHGFVDVNDVFLNIDAPDTPPGIGTFGRSVNDNAQILLYGAIAYLTALL